MSGWGGNQYRTAPGRTATSQLLSSLARPADWWVHNVSSQLGQPYCPPGILRQHSHVPNAAVRAQVAGHPGAPPDVLVTLSHDDKPMVRNNVASNPSAPTKALRHLAHDPNQWTRWAVAQHPGCPPELLQQMLQDPDRSGSVIIDDAERSNPYIRLQADKLLQHPKLRSVFVIYNQ